MILLVVFIPSSFFVSNIFDGLMWFLLPCSLVIINDIGAYLFGMQPAVGLNAANAIIAGLYAVAHVIIVNEIGANLLGLHLPRHVLFNAATFRLFVRCGRLCLYRNAPSC